MSILVSGGRRPAKARLAAVALAAVTAGSVAMISGCGSKAVASINGQSLSEEEFHRLCETATNLQPDGRTVGMQVLQRWIMTSLMEQEAKKQNVYPSQSELQSHVDAMKREAAAQGTNLDDVLRQQGITPEDFKRQQLEQLIQYDLFCNGVTVSDAEVNQEFDKRKDQPPFAKPEQVRMSMITVLTEKDKNDARSDLAGGANFKLVAQTRSKDPFARSGGEVPGLVPRKVTPGGQVPQEAVDAAYKLTPGATSDPIKVGQSWVIVRLDEKTEKKLPKLDDYRELIRSSIRQQKATQNGKLNENRARLMQTASAAKLQVFQPAYKSFESQFNQAASTAAQGGAGGMGGPPGAPGG